ncbi:MAG: DUF4440 domain-containing protein [Pseudomonadota bacterium]
MIGFNAMTRLTRASSLSLAIALAACSDDPMGLTQQDVADLRAASERWVALYNTNDWRALAQEFTDDAAMMPPGFPTVRGQRDIAAWEADNEIGFKIAFDIESIDGHGNFAAIRGRSCIFIPTGDGSYRVDVGKFLETRVRDADGAWRIQSDAFNSDAPAGTALQDGCPFSEIP